MDERELIELRIDISAPKPTDPGKLAKQFLSDLQELNVDSAQVMKAETERGGEAASFVSIGLAVLPALLPGVIQHVQSWLLRGRGRTVRFKGRGIEFEGSADNLQKLLEALASNNRLPGGITTPAPKPKPKPR